MTLIDIYLKPEQIEAVEHLCKGKDILLTLPTGYGKSMIVLSVLLTLQKAKVKFMAMI